jgi:hypothetical protein
LGVARETVMAALLQKLAASGTYALIGRRARDPETVAVAGSPALMLIGHTETYTRTHQNLPPVRTLGCKAIIYIDVGNDETLVPDAIINPLLDGIDQALIPDDPGSGFCTLGGIVYSILINGEIIKAAGDISGKGLAIIPIEIVLP